MHKLKPRIRLLVLQPTTFCNINCNYCYLPAASRASKRVMTARTITNTFRRAFESGWVDKQITVSWHAGEPLVLPIEYYEGAFRNAGVENRSNARILHSFQTNGMLITDDWCNFFKRHDVRIGISIDGPKAIHDANRKTRSGKGTFDLVLRGIETLKRNKIKFSVIAVVTRESVNRPDELFRFFFEELGASGVSLNPEEMDGANVKSSLDEAPMISSYYSFLAKFWTSAIETGNAHNCREIERMLSSVIRPSNTEMLNEQAYPFAILNVDWEGNFTTFSPEFLGMQHSRYGNFYFGNVNTDPLSAAFEHPNFLALYSDILSGVEICKQTCEYYSICGGGAPANKLMENGTLESSQTLFCKLSTKMNCDLAIKFIEAGGAKLINKSLST